MHFTFLFVLSFVSWTEQHLSYPINYCNMATTCIHDNRQVCAATPNGCSRRTFLDQCDMYEYNCDYNTRYQETYMLFCMTSDLEAGVLSTKVLPTAYEIKNMPEQIPQIEENLIDVGPPAIPITCVSTSSTTTPNIIPTTAHICSTTKPCICATTNTNAKFATTPTTTTKSTPISTTTPKTISTNKITTKTTIITTSTIPVTTTNTPTRITTPVTTTTASMKTNTTPVSTTTVSMTTSMTPVIATTTSGFQPVTTKSKVTTTLFTSTSSPKPTVSISKPQKLTLTKLLMTTIRPTTITVVKTNSNKATNMVPERNTQSMETFASTSKHTVPIELNHETVEMHESTQLKLVTFVPETTVIKDLGFTGCCQRPLTWETTTEDINTTIFYPNSEDNLILQEITSTFDNNETTTNYLAPIKSTTFIPSSTTKSTIINTHYSTINDTSMPDEIASETTQMKNVTSTILQTTTVETSTCISCDRPKTWETTTEAPETIYIYPIDEIEETVASTFAASSTSTTTEKTSTKPISVKPTISLSTSTVSMAALPMTFAPNSTETKSISSIILQTTTIPMETTETIKETTICMDCQRPKVWETTTEKDAPFYFIITERDTVDTTTEKNTELVPEVTDSDSTEETTEITTTTESVTTASQSKFTTDTTTSYINSTSYVEEFQPSDCDTEAAVPVQAAFDAEDDYLENDFGIVKLSKEKLYMKTSRCGPNCGRPFSWMTTAKGETRDFFRILKSAENFGDDYEK